MTRINERIRAPRIRVIVAATNEQLGIMSPQDGLAEAKRRGLDLVEVAAKADPPVCRIVDYGKYKYEQAKLKKAGGAKPTPKLKEVKFRVRTDPHDYNIKLSHAEDFLEAGNKVRIQLQFRGRENAHHDVGFAVMQKIKGDLTSMGHVDMEPKLAGRQITMMLSPLPRAHEEAQIPPLPRRTSRSRRLRGRRRGRGRGRGVRRSVGESCRPLEAAPVAGKPLD